MPRGKRLIFWPRFMKDKVVLYYPRYVGPPLGAPLSLLSVASPLLEAGFRVSIIDGAIEPQVEERLKRELDDALCFGVSLLTGPMILEALHICRTVRLMQPALPIVYGGWHPSLTADQTLRHPDVDIVVRGQGELALLEVAQKLRQGKTVEDVRGVSFRQGGEVFHNLDRPVENINRLPRPAFELAQFDAYERITGKRTLAYASSLGCPYACNYCTDQVFYERRFNAYTASRVVHEVADLAERHRLTGVSFLDSNFPVHVARAIDIAKGFIDAKTGFGWTFQASTDLLCRMTDDEVCLLGSAGVRHMGFGTESASDNVLGFMNKKHQRVEDMYETARKANLARIRVTFNIILGYPGETEADRLQTFRVMSDIARQYSVVSFSPNIFTPYPGIPIWPELKANGVKEPESLEDWAAVDLGSNHLPWLQGEDLRRLRRMLEYFLLNNQIRKGAANRRWVKPAVQRALGVPLRWRLKRNRYGFPWELWVARTLAQRSEQPVSRRSLLTGRPLSRELREVC